MEATLLGESSSSSFVLKYINTLQQIPDLCPLFIYLFIYLFMQKHKCTVPFSMLGALHELAKLNGVKKMDKFKSKEIRNKLI